MSYSTTHLTAFRRYESNGHSVRGLSDDMLEALLEDPNFNHEVAAERQRREDVELRREESETRALLTEPQKNADSGTRFSRSDADAVHKWRDLFVNCARALTDEEFERAVAALNTFLMEESNAIRNAPYSALATIPLLCRAMNVKNVERNTKIAALEARVAELEMRPKGMTYRGICDAGRVYEPGDVVTHSGSMWVATRRTGDTPGEGGNTGWLLAVKRGRDGKDAR